MNRDEILNIDDLATDQFEVPKWGTVTIRELDGEQREELENLIQNFKARAGGRKSVRALAAVYSMLDSTGQLMFKPEDAQKLAKKSSVALDSVFARVIKLNAMSKEEAGELAGN